MPIRHRDRCRLPLVHSEAARPGLPKLLNTHSQLQEAIQSSVCTLQWRLVGREVVAPEPWSVRCVVRASSSPGTAATLHSKLVTDNCNPFQLGKSQALSAIRYENQSLWCTVNKPSKSPPSRLSMALRAGQISVGVRR